jgi:alpha-beta hydrolase superfamily lysophospholipase
LARFVHEWRPSDQTTGVVCILHGQGEHSARYTRVAKGLIAAGFATIAVDLRGNGRSEGPRGHTPTYHDLLRDTKSLLRHATGAYPGLPCFLYGHSFGGNIALNYVLRTQGVAPQPAGVIVTAPWLRLTREISALRVILAHGVLPLRPSFTVSTSIDRPKLRLGPYTDAIDEQDPLSHDRISMRTFLSARSSGRWAIKHAPELQVPTVILHGDQDEVTDPRASAAFATRAGAVCESHVLPGQYHNLHEQGDLGPLLGHVTDWLDRQVGL